MSVYRYFLLSFTSFLLPASFLARWIGISHNVRLFIVIGPNFVFIPNPLSFHIHVAIWVISHKPLTFVLFHKPLSALCTVLIKFAFLLFCWTFYLFWLFLIVSKRKCYYTVVKCYFDIVYLPTELIHSILLLYVSCQILPTWTGMVKGVKNVCLRIAVF